MPKVVESETRLGVQGRGSSHKPVRPSCIKVNGCPGEPWLLFLWRPQHDLRRARILLDRHPPGPGEADLRGFERRRRWHSVKRLRRPAVPNSVVLAFADVQS